MRGSEARLDGDGTPTVGKRISIEDIRFVRDAIDCTGGDRPTIEIVMPIAVPIA